MARLKIYVQRYRVKNGKKITFASPGKVKGKDGISRPGLGSDQKAFMCAPYSVKDTSNLSNEGTNLVTTKCFAIFTLGVIKQNMVAKIDGDDTLYTIARIDYAANPMDRRQYDLIYLFDGNGVSHTYRTGN